MESAGRDPAAQPERTRMAWRRTTLTCVAVALLAGRQALHDQTQILGVEAMVAVVLALAVGVFIHLAHRRARMMHAAQPAAISPRWVVTVAGCMTAIGVFGAVLIF